MTNWEPILAVMGLIFVAMITPGPNNFIVMSRAARSGFGSAATSAMGVLIGTQLLLMVIWLGADMMFDLIPNLRVIVVICGAGFLALLGTQMIWRSWKNTTYDLETSDTGVPDGVIGLAVFQFLNPKSWVLVVAAVATASELNMVPIGLMSLAVIFFTISSICLLVWIVAGVRISGWLQTNDKRRLFDGGLGLMLLVCGVTLMVG